MQQVYKLIIAVDKHISLLFLSFYLGNVYIADNGSHRIRKVTVSTGIITTVAGNGISTYNGDNMAATSARLAYPLGFTLDSAGNLS